MSAAPRCARNTRSRLVEMIGMHALGRYGRDPVRSSKRTARPLSLFVLVASFLIVVMAWAGNGRWFAVAADESIGQEFEVQFADRLLTVRAVEVPLETALATIAEKANVRLVLDGELTDSVTTSFTDIPVDEAIQRLLGETPSVMRYISSEGDGGDRLEVVYVLARQSDMSAKSGLTADGQSQGEDLPNTVVVSEQQTVQYGSEERKARINEVQELANAANAGKVEELSVLVTLDADPLVRRVAVIGLGKIQNPETLPALQKALSDEDRTVRLGVVVALGKMHGNQAANLLGTALLQDPEPHIRRMAAERLGRLGGESALVALRTAQADTDDSVRRAVESALTRLERP